MTPEQAIEILIAYANGSGDYPTNDFETALLMGAEAVERMMITKKPYLDNENGEYEQEFCPTCHRRLFPNEHHCRCGQLLDWSDVE